MFVNMLDNKEATAVFRSELSSSYVRPLPRG